MRGWRRSTKQIRRYDEVYLKLHPELFPPEYGITRILVLHLVGSRQNASPLSNASTPFLYEEGYVEYIDGVGQTVVGRWPSYDNGDSLAVSVKEPA